jgi:type I restriction enzyme, S subunit
VLASAFKGLFTQDWRNKYSNKKSSEQIIKQVLSEKEKIAKSSGFKLPPIGVVDEEEILSLPDLPETWTWITPDEISSPEKYSIGIGPFGSNLKVSDYKSEGVPLVFVKNITRNNFTLDLKFITDHKLKELIAHSIKPLDIVITKMGDPPGDCAIYPENRPVAVITSDCLKFRVWDKYSNRKYFKYCIETNIIKKQLGLRTKGVAQKKISSSRFKTILFPFTEIEEQDEIVRQIESRLSIADKMEESINQSLQQAEALKQSILKKAFEGKLL